MRYLPIHVDVQDQPCTVVGGGEVAARKLALLQRAGARVTVVAPALCATLAGLEATGSFLWQARPFDQDCLAGARLVIAATDDAQVNHEVAQSAASQGILVNVVDAPGQCSFIMPALVDRSPIVISISSEGTAPVLATRIRRRLEAALPPSIASLARFMGRHRGEVKAALPNATDRRGFWTRFLDSAIPALLETDPAAGLAAFRLLLAGEAPVDPREVHLALASADPLDLTLRSLALLGEADRICHDAAVPTTILEYARRDATFIPWVEGAGLPAPAGAGLTLFLTIASREA